MPRLFLRLAPAFLAVLLALSARSMAQQVLISEFMAANDRTLADEDGEFPDWVELYNPGTQPVDLNGWFLTDSSTNLIKWRIPAVTLQPGAFKVVFCSGKNRINTSANLHTSFKLDADGEYCALVRKDGSTIEWEYGPTYPPQQTDVSYGLGFTGASRTLVAAADPARALVPTQAIDPSWTQAGFNDASWQAGTTGVGYERGTGYESLIGLDVISMYTTNGTCYIRVPFTLDAIPAVDTLTLRMKYDDGFVAYLNGTRVASANAPSTLLWNSAARTSHDDALAVSFVDYDISSFRSKLNPGANVLAIHGLNSAAGGSDFLILPQVEASVGSTVELSSRRYFTVPSPGIPNGVSSGDQGPTISALSHSPAEPSDTESLVVTAKVTPAKDPIATVKMSWRVQYGTVNVVTMLDDGLHGDGAANDGVYGATIPASASTPGQMVRYFVTATDTASRPTRNPFFSNPTASPEYQGTVVKSPSVTSSLPIFWWFVQSPSAAATETGTRASLYYDGEFYDNVFCRLRGMISTTWPKKSFKFDMNSGYHFRYQQDQERVEEINLNTTFSDKAYVRVPLAWDSYQAVGVPYCVCLPFHVRQNGAFYSVATFVEQMDEAYLTRNGIDADGALYKMTTNNMSSSTASLEKKTRKWEDNSDLEALVQGIRRTGSALSSFLFDNLDVPEVLNHLATTVVMQDTDSNYTNYYMYRDTEGNREWQILPWDRDMTFGRMWYGENPLNDWVRGDWDNTSHPLVNEAAHPLNRAPYQWNYLVDAVYRESRLRQMYLRRLRTVMDDLLQPAGTPADQLWYETRCQEYYNLMRADVALDRAKWGNPFGANQDFAAAIEVLRTQYLVPRRYHLYITHSKNSGLIPATQGAHPDIRFGVIEREPASGNQEEEFVELVNPGLDAVDISGWSLAGDVRHTFRSGTVIPANSGLYVSPNVVAFRARQTWPTGGLGLFVQGDYRGQLALPSEPLELRDVAGALVASVRFTPADAVTALGVAAGTLGLPPDGTARLNVATDGDSRDRVDLSDAAVILRELAR